MHRFLPTLGLLCFSIASQATIYKWVDEHGVTQFSQFPPVNQAAEQVRGAPPPADDPAVARERLEQQLEGFDERRAAQETERQEQAQQQEQQALRQRNCAAARHNLQVLERTGRTRVQTEDGEVTYLSDEQRQERVEAARQAVKKYCD